MELTKADLKHIDVETNLLMKRINIEATEYAKLYEQKYLETLADKIIARVEAIGYVSRKITELTNK